MESSGFVAPSQKLYRARHKVTRYDLWKSFTVDDLSLTTNEPSLLDYSVPFLQNLPSCKVTANSSGRSSSVFSLPGTAGSEHGSQDDLPCANGELQNLMLRNYSLDSLILHNKKRIMDHENNVSMMKALSETPTQVGHNYATCSRPLSLPPKPSQEKTIHEDAIAEVVKNAERLESQDARILKYTNKDLMRREQYMIKQWAEIDRSGSKDILLEVRRRGLLLDALPWQLRPKIYDLCLVKDIKVRPTSQHHARLLAAIVNALDERGDEIFNNIYARSKWLETGSPPAPNFYQVFELEFESLYFHITVELGLNPVKQFVWPLLVSVLCGWLDNGSADLVVKLIDALVLTSYFRELDELLDRIWVLVLKKHSYKFFGSRQEIEDEIQRIDVHQPTLWQELQALQTQKDNNYRR